ncbi:zinc ribbon domain-containing protein [Candidatus Micrarchaeota archaeon]|nr:zinc ribbon domain-containing protein [Candidatus Micrarchaeota archaeon]
MAAVVSGCNWCKILLAMLIVLSLAAPAGEFLTKDTASWISVMELTGRDTVLTAKLSVSSLNIEEQGDLSKLEDAIQVALEGNDQASQDILQDELEGYLGQFEAVSEPLEGAEIYFYYYEKYTPETQEGLEATEGAESVLRKHYISGCDPAPPTDSGGKTTCTVPKEVYTHELVQDAQTLSAETCVQVYATFADPQMGATYEDDFKTVTETIMFCGKDATVLGVIAGMVNSGLQERLGSPLCFASILMCGLLLASMFFSGRSPHSLMDITTPLLPKAKTISYSGLTMGAGFGRIKGQMAEIASDLQRAAKATMPELLRELRARGVSQRVINAILDSKASNTIKLLAMRAALAGKDMRYVSRVLKLRNFKWVESEEDAKAAEEYGEIIRELREAPLSRELNDKRGLHDRVIDLVDMDVRNQMQIAAFGKATGDMPKWLGKGVGSTLGRIPFIGEHIKGATASFAFGTRRILKFYPNLLRSAVRGADSVMSGGKNIKRIQMAVDAKRKEGKKASGFQNWIALSPEERRLVTFYDHFAKGEADYKRLMKEAERDITNYLIGCLLEHYFSDNDRRKMNLTREQVMRIGLEGPDSLLFKNFNMKGFRAVEFELRRILSNKNLNELQKAERIIQLMRNNNVHFDARAVAALNMLRRIQTEVPQSFDQSEGYDTPEERETVINAHRYVRLRRYLEEQFRINDAIDFESVTKGGEFTFLVGRQQLYDSQGNDYTFGAFFRANYRRMLEREDTLDDFNVTGRTLLQHAGDYTFLRIANERFGVLNPDSKNLGKTELGVDVRLVMKNMESWLKNLAIASGFAGIGKDASKFTDLAGQLYISGARGDRKDDMLAISSHGEEYGPRKGLWRVDMHAHWRTVGGPMRGAVSCVEEQAYGEVKRAHMVPRAVQDMLDERYSKGGKLTFEQAERARINQLIESHLFSRLKGIMEVDNPNTYFTSKGEFDRFIGLWDSYRAHLFNTQKNERGYAHYTSVSDSDIKRYMKKSMGLSELSDGVWLRLREGQYVPFVTEHATKLGQADRIVNAKYYIKRGGRWSEFAPDTIMRGQPLREILFGKDSAVLSPEREHIKDLSAPDLQAYTNIMRSFADAKERARADGRQAITLADLRLSDNDLRKFFARLSAISDSGNKKAIRGCGAAIMRMFEENGMELGTLFGRNISNIREIGNRQLREQVSKENMLYRYTNSANSLERAQAVVELKAWAEAGAPKEDRRTKLAMLFYHNGKQSGNWSDFNNYREAIRLLPGSAPLPEDMRGWDKIEAANGIRGFIKKAFYSASDILSPHLKNANVGLEQFMLNTFGSQTRTSYEGSLTSEYFRQTGARFAAKLAAGEYGDPTDRNSAAMKEYNRLVDSFLRYHCQWDENVTRDPRGNSAGIGNSFIFSSFFHMGPATAYGPAPYRRWNYGGFNKPWYSWSNIKSSLMDLQYSPFVFNYAVGSPLLLGYRSYITNRWGAQSKYDRKYSGAGGRGLLSPEEAQSSSALGQDTYATEGYNQMLRKQQERHRLEMEQYNQQVAARADAMARAGMARERAQEEARRELASQMPTMPSPELTRDTLNPFHSTAPRFADARRSMVNWFYSSFDPRATKWQKTAASFIGSPMLPFYMMPVKPIQNFIMNKGFFLMDRADNAPYYERPGAVRSGMMKAMGSMVERGFGGAEMQRGVTRSVEDTWMFQSGVNAVWGNANPGASYVDFSQNLHMDSRAANYLRYESRFRPFFKSDEYVDKQANIGIIKRDIDPFNALMQRNSEIQSYKFFRGGEIGDNSLFRFINPALWAFYKGREYKMKIDRAAYSLDSMMKDNISNDGMSRGSKVLYGLDRFARQKVVDFGNYLHRKTVLGATKSIVHCGSCGSPHAAGSACTACRKKVRCPHCGSLCDPFQNHSCSFGVHRNLKMDELRGDRNVERELERRRKWGRAA